MKRIIRGIFNKVATLLFFVFLVVYLGQDYTKNYINLHILGWVTGVFLIIYLALKIPLVISYVKRIYVYLIKKKHSIRKKYHDVESIFKTINTYITPLFSFLLVAYLIILLVEEFKVGLISTRVNMTYFLIAVIITGAITIFLPQSKKKEKPAKKSDFIFTFLLAIGGAVLIYFKTREMGWLSYIIAIIAGVLIFFMGTLIVTDEEKPQDVYSENR
jgi:hypothetical protein